VSIAFGICRGIVFMHCRNIIHHDIRCENIMITSSLVPKISNFKYTRYVDDADSKIPNISEIINWLAPEKLRNVNLRYDNRCEIFR